MEKLSAKVKRPLWVAGLNIALALLQKIKHKIARIEIPLPLPVKSTFMLGPRLGIIKNQMFFSLPHPITTYLKPSYKLMVGLHMNISMVEMQMRTRSL